jgi:hypothetical protein
MAKFNINVTVIFVFLVVMGVFAHQASHLFSHSSTSAKLPPIPPNYELKAVAVVHRHGDRSQIARSAGPAFPHNEKLDQEWIARMPSSQSIISMTAAAVDDERFEDASAQEVLERDIDINIDQINSLNDEVYSGWERANYPYGQLTERGFQELKSVGKELRRRYVGTLLPNDVSQSQGEYIHARSTNFCRTKQSLRSLLVGLFDIRPSATSDPSDMGTSTTGVRIKTKPKAMEIMFPQAGGLCSAIGLRRAELYADNYIAETWQGMESYYNLYDQVFTMYGYKQEGDSDPEIPLNWMTTREVMVCSLAHDLPRPKELTEDIVKDVDNLAGFMWNRLYDDSVLNRLAIGRFIGEFMNTLQGSLKGKSESKLLLYSGHDSTIVPFLCALGISDGSWPLYASHLELEVAHNIDDNELYVRAIFNNEEQIIEGCGSVWCPYFRFKRKMEALIVSDSAYEMECGVMDEDDSNNNSAAAREMQAEIKATTGGA